MSEVKLYDHQGNSIPIYSVKLLNKYRHLSNDRLVGKMNNAEILNKILKKYNQGHALKLLKDELGTERTKMEMEKFNFNTLTKSNFIHIAQEWGFFNDYISDENWEEYKEHYIT